MTEIAITGSTGVVGMALLRLLTERGHNVKALIRSDAGEAIAVEN
jgi:nucleoside-diphosphate-sugar epimerase